MQHESRASEWVLRVCAGGVGVQVEAARAELGRQREAAGHAQQQAAAALDAQEQAEARLQ